MTWRGRSVQCCICSKWVHLRCSLLSFSRFKTLGTSHSWSCPPCCLPISSGGPTPTNTVTSSSDTSILYPSTFLAGPSGSSLLMHSRSVLVFKPPIPFPPTLYFLSLYSHQRLMFQAVFLYLLLPLSSPLDSLRVLQWNAGCFRARSTELPHFISSHPVDLIRILESNLNLSFSFRIPGFYALRCDRTHSRSGIFSSDTTYASGGGIIFVRQRLSFSELSISSLSLLDP